MRTGAGMGVPGRREGNINERKNWRYSSACIIATMHFGFGMIFAIIGMIFGYISLGYTSYKLSYLGVMLNNIALVWLAIICVIGGGV